MTVLAFDGHTLAADKRAVLGSMILTTTKIFRVNKALVGYAGDACFGEEMVAWYGRGAKPEDFPTNQRDKDDWSGLMVFKKGDRIARYERSPYPVRFDSEKIAVGCGRDFAMAAMYLGKTAREAVEVAIALDNCCGNGIDTLSL